LFSTVQYKAMHLTIVEARPLTEVVNDFLMSGNELISFHDG
ncbi:MAG: hypothetical protein V7642_4943, partial [Burkholderiales bacterium]